MYIFLSLDGEKDSYIMTFKKRILTGIYSQFLVPNNEALYCTRSLFFFLEI